MPLILRRQLEFPYAEGLLFVTDVWGLGGYNAVNQALQTPPPSTEQILHSEKYYNHEAPVAVTIGGPVVGARHRLRERLPADDGRAQHPGPRDRWREAAGRHPGIARRSGRTPKSRPAGAATA